MKKLIIITLAFIMATMIPEMSLQAQDLAHYKQVVKELSSAKYQGRGYAYGGANKAGKYLAKEYKNAGVDEIMLQPFTIDINTFPGKMEMSVDGRKLIPGVEFSMREYSPGVRGTYKLYYVDTNNYNAEKMFADLAKPEYKDCFVVCDFFFSYRHYQDFKKIWGKEGCTNAGMIQTWDPLLKFYKAYGEKIMGKPVIWTTSDFPKDAQSITVNIENKFLKDYELFNVIAKVEGKRHDSCFVFTAHYDHLGNLGKKVFYAGANDNASGNAAIVTLAAYYAQNRPEFDMYFISFSGEDANLRGSEWFVAHPIVPLEQIKFLINIDMIGDNNPVQYLETNSDRGFATFDKINSEKKYFKDLNRGELAGNSDHYPFTEKGVPSILFENEEGDAFKYYHTPFDTYENALFDTYEPLFRLVRDFVEKY
ncbi:MAG: M28 family peptidase [Bacteroidales bacterium]|nr:M28 family peptidase [Bacteroidales bacterium]